jgi:hypothetical protein
MLSELWGSPYYRYKFLQRFRSLLSEINSFLKERRNENEELENEKWLFDLEFLADFTDKLSDMNLELQGKNKSIAEMILQKQIRANDD